MKINCSQGELNNASVTMGIQSSSVLLFSKPNSTILGYVDPVNITSIIRINNFRGELTDVSAETKTLVQVV